MYSIVGEVSVECLKDSTEVSSVFAFDIDFFPPPSLFLFSRQQMAIPIFSFFMIIIDYILNGCN